MLNKKYNKCIQKYNTSQTTWLVGCWTSSTNCQSWPIPNITVTNKYIDLWNLRKVRCPVSHRWKSSGLGMQRRVWRSRRCWRASSTGRWWSRRWWLWSMASHASGAVCKSKSDWRKSMISLRWGSLHFAKNYHKWSNKLWDEKWLKSFLVLHDVWMHEVGSIFPSQNLQQKLSLSDYMHFFDPLSGSCSHVGYLAIQSPLLCVTFYT